MVGGVRALGDDEVEGYAGRVGGGRTDGIGEVLGSGRLVGEDCVRGGGSEDLAVVAAGAWMGSGKGWEDGEEGKRGAEGEMHGRRCKSTSDAVVRLAGRPTSQAAFEY